MLSTRIWMTINATLENVSSVEIQSYGETELVRIADALRERGWQHAAEHPLSAASNGGWPPDEADFDIELSREEIGFIRDKLRDDIDLTRQILREPDLHPEVRAEQEADLTLLQAALEELEHPASD